MVTFFFTRRESRPLLALWLILIMRQLCQASVSMPPPDGMIWRYPGFPTIVVTYSTSTDFFFSGHMALATLLAAELTAQRAPRLKQADGLGIRVRAGAGHSLDAVPLLHRRRRGLSRGRRGDPTRGGAAAGGWMRASRPGR